MPMSIMLYILICIKDVGAYTSTGKNAHDTYKNTKSPHYIENEII